MRQTMASSNSKERPSQVQSKRLAPLSYVAFGEGALPYLAPLLSHTPTRSEVPYGSGRRNVICFLVGSALATTSVVAI
jgi:hypothetical protein